MAARLLIFVLGASPMTLHAAEQGEAASVSANPIRKVVTMLQAMQKKVSEEGEQEEVLYKKFMCYCKNSGGDLAKSIETGSATISGLGPDIRTAEEQKAQAEASLGEAQDDRNAAKAATKEAQAVREKEAAAFASFKAEYGANIDAIGKAVAALEKGAAGAFLQTGSVEVLRRLVKAGGMAIGEEDRGALLAFLEGRSGSEYAPQSGQITGILKDLGDEMAKALAEATATEKSAIETHEELVASKAKEIKVLTAKIESSLGKIGELGVSVAQMKNDLGDTEEALMADKEFAANLEKSCATKTEEWDQRVKTRSEELVALADTIKVLNDDDALELFKKTLPSPSASFLQVQGSTSLRRRAMVALREGLPASPDRARLDLILLALHGKKIGFEKVVAMIDGMVATLKTEQSDDDKKKEYCSAQFDLSDDKKKALERSVADAETAIAKATDGIATLKEEAAALTAGITALDKSVAEATEQRKNEHDEFTQLMASNTAAKELLGFAKNRLHKFYNPKLFKPAAKRELAAQDRIAVNLGGGTAPPTPAPGGIAGTGIAVLAEISAHRGQQHVEAAPPPPPETFGEYAKQSEMNTGVIAMINLLIKDLDKEMTEAETEEKDAQADYEAMTKDSANKRVADSKSLSEKESAAADLRAELESHKDDKASATNELAATLKYISSLHGECDWLVKYFDVRKQARASEIDALGKAKAVLGGADYALVQTDSRAGLLRGSKSGQ